MKKSNPKVNYFQLQDIADTFEGNFKEQSGINSNWLPVNSAKVCLFYVFLLTKIFRISLKFNEC